MNILSRHIILLIVTILLAVTSSCSDSDNPIDDAVYENLSGVWYGTHYYVNNGNVKYHHLTITLNSDRTGTMEYDAPASFSAASFTWNVSGEKLICEGAYANSDGESGNYSLQCRIENGRLYPIDQYTAFILTKDNSVMTDGNGDEVASEEDQFDMLQNVWVASDKKSVLEFFSNGEYEEYILDYAGSQSYSELYVKQYVFSPLTKKLTVETSTTWITWDVVTLDNKNLVLDNGNRTLSYTIGSRNDVPKKIDLKAYLSSADIWSDNTYSIKFTTSGVVAYYENSGRKYGSYGIVSLCASGTYSLNGSKATCQFTDVSWEGGTSGASKWFPGWVCNQSCTKVYDIEAVPPSSIKVTLPNSKVVYLDKL